MASRVSGEENPVCPTCSGALKRIFYPSSGHGSATTSEKLYDDPAVILICPKCRCEWSRWCDQPEKKCIKAGCEIHTKELCLWELCKKNGNITSHWVLLCRICRSEGDKTREKSKSKNGAVRGRCSNCGVCPCFYTRSTFLFLQNHVSGHRLFPFGHCISVII